MEVDYFSKQYVVLSDSKEVFILEENTLVSAPIDDVVKYIKEHN